MKTKTFLAFLLLTARVALGADLAPSPAAPQDTDNATQLMQKQAVDIHKQVIGAVSPQPISAVTPIPVTAVTPIPVTATTPIPITAVAPIPITATTPIPI